MEWRKFMELCLEYMLPLYKNNLSHPTALPVYSSANSLLFLSSSLFKAAIDSTSANRLIPVHSRLTPCSCMTLKFSWFLCHLHFFLISPDF